MQGERDADTLAEAPFALLREYLAPPPVVGELRRLEQHALGVVALPQHLSVGEQIAGLYRIQETYVERVHLKPFGGKVHSALDREYRLRRAEAAKGPVGRRVRRPGAAPYADVRHIITARRVQVCALEDDARQRRIGPRVEFYLRVERRYLTILCESHAVAAL